MSGNEVKVIGLYDKEGHLKSDVLIKLKNGDLNGDALMAALDHIAECPDCALAYSSLFEESDLKEPPRGFEEELQSNLAQRKKSKTGKNDFALYVVKVAVAASIAIIITFSGSIGSIPNYTSKIQKANSASQSFLSSISEKFSSFSKNLANMEVFTNETKKK